MSLAAKSTVETKSHRFDQALKKAKQGELN